MTSNHDLNSPEQIAANKAKREHERLKKQKQRVRYAEQDELDELLKLDPAEFQAAVWAKNKAKLTKEEIAALETRQDEFIRLATQVQDVIDGLPKGRKIDPANGGLAFVDTLYDECVSGGFVGANDGSKLVFHLMAVELGDLHRNIAGRAYQHFTENVDAEWFKFGVYTRFLTTMWNEFVDVVARYIIEHSTDENLEKVLCDRILAEYQTHQPRHVAQMTHHNLLESEQRAEYDRVSSLQLEKEIIEAQKHNFHFPSSEF
jgi:hypothetical protein